MKPGTEQNIDYFEGAEKREDYRGFKPHAILHCS